MASKITRLYIAFVVVYVESGSDGTEDRQYVIIAAQENQLAKDANGMYKLGPAWAYIATKYATLRHCGAVLLISAHTTENDARVAIKDYDKKVWGGSGVSIDSWPAQWGRELNA